MAMQNCPECKKEIAQSAPACPHCGWKRRSVLIWIIGIGFALWFGFWVGEKLLFSHPEVIQRAR
jgi:hypothetical protein